MPEEGRPQQSGELLGAYIRAQRKLADLSLRQLADMSDVSNAYLSQIERGLHQPSLKVLRSIAGALNLSSESLLVQAGLLDAATPSKGGVGEQLASPSGHAGVDALGTRVVDTETAIRADPHLTEEERQVLLSVYRNFRNRRA